MTIPRPFRSLPLSGIRKLLLWTLIPTIAAIFFLRSLGAPLVNDVAPAGIVSYELAADFQTSSAILESWNASARVSAGLSLGFDFLFLVLYAFCLSAACAMVADGIQNRSSALADIGFVISWAVLLAGLLDAIENIALVSLLTGADSNLLPFISRWAAIPKFLFLSTGIVYIIFGALYRLVIKRSPTS